MDNSSTVIAHYNTTLGNQRLYAQHIAKGLSRLDIKHEITSDPDLQGDIHICIGPHYAFSQCLGKRTIYIDRCLWGDDLEYVTIGWLNDDGGMVYPTGCDDLRQKPDLFGWRDSTDRAIFLLDYPMRDFDIIKSEFSDVGVRYHPAIKPNQISLDHHLSMYDVAIGWRTSALVTAAVNGMPVISFDSRSPVYPIAGRDIMDIRKPCRKQWLNNLSYAQWSGKEIASGEALEYVLKRINLS